LKKFPYFVQDVVVTVYNFKSYRARRGGEYNRHRSYYSSDDKLEAGEWRALQEIRLKDILIYTTSRSALYLDYRGRKLSEFPVLRKEDIIKNLDRIRAMPEGQGKVRMTGGTTGASMKVVYDISDS